MRIAIDGFHIESCTFSPLMTKGEDFLVQRGEDLINNYDFLDKFPGISFVPLVRATAIPGGPVESSFYQRIKSELINGLRNGSSWDGIFLHMHGAAYVDGLEDTEGDLIEAIREAVGKDCLIAASYDLHGNVSPRVVDNIDIISAYRTAPHVDWYETVERTCTILVNCLKQKIRPHLSFVPVPILLPGEQTSTEWEPASTLYSLIPGVVEKNNLIDASILIGYVWADEPRASASIITIGTDQKSVEASAKYLAQALWDARKKFKFGVPVGLVDECIKDALNFPEKPVIISDSGDNPTAGGVGDVPYVLERLVSLRVPDAVYASIMDEEAVTACEMVGEGAEISLVLGGKRDCINGKPLNVIGTVELIKEVPWSLGGLNKNPKMNKIVVLQVQGVKVIVTKYRTPFHHIVDFEQIGISPGEHKIIVVKIGYLVPELKQIAAQALLALSPGAVNQNITGLNFTRIRRPQFPFDPDMEWNPSTL